MDWVSVTTRLERRGKLPVGASVVAALAVVGLVAGCVRPVMVSPAMYSDPSRSILTKRPSSAEQPQSGVRPLLNDDAVDSAVQKVVELGDEQPSAGTGAQPAPRVRWNEAGDMTLNVADADLVEVVKLVMEDGLDANYIIDPAVSGRVTVRTKHAVPAEDIVAMLESVLNLNGAALTREGDLYKIVPREKSDAGGLVNPGEAGSGIQVTPIRYADAIQLSELLQPFAVEGNGSVQADPSRNLLMLKGSSREFVVMNDLIDTFDVDWMAGKSVGLFPLKYALPSDLAEELGQLFRDPDTGLTSGKLRFLPIDRLQSLVIIANQPDPLQRAEIWIERLDKKGEGANGGERIYVYEVQNGRASDLAEILGELFDIESTTVGEPALPLDPGGFGDTELVSSSEDDDDVGGRRRAARSSSSGRDPFASAFGRPDFSDEGSEKPGAKIVADETTNALLIRSTEEEYQKIAEALRELDTLPLQVLVEATIAEVTLQDELSYGVQWFFGSSKNNGVTLSEFADGVVGEVFPGFSGVLSSGGDARVVLNALDDVSDVKILSSPQVMVLDNQPAYFKVGDEVPIVTQQAQGLDFSDSRVVNTVEQRQTGVILQVTPRVNANGLVILDIEQEVSNVVRTTTSGIDSPTIAQRSVGTSVSVESDQTIILGGLMQDNSETREAGVPILSKIPVIGALFGFSQVVNKRTELLVMIKPKVITNQSDAVAATQEVKRQFRGLEPMQTGTF